MLKTFLATFNTAIMGSSLSHQSAIDIISNWRAKPAHELIFDSSRQSTEQYFQAVDKLQTTPTDKRSTELLSIAMARLKKEFQAVLSRQAEFPAGPTSTMEWSSVTDTTAYTLRYEDFTGYQIPNQEVVIYLREIVKRMKVNGSLNECVSIYKSVRSNFLQGQLKKLHYNDLMVGENLRRFSWDELKVKIELWNQVSKICVKIFFEKEKELSGKVFGGFDGVSDECFVGTVQELVNGLFAFVQAVSLSNQSYDRLGTVFGFYSAFWWLLPNVKSLFGCERGIGIRKGCEEMEGKIESEVERMLLDLERTVLNEIPNSSDDRGGIYKTTSIVMDLVDHIVENRVMLSTVIKSSPSLNADGSIFTQVDLGDTRKLSFLELHLILIVRVLQRNIVQKSKARKEPLGHVFIMNNFHHIVKKIQGSNELQEMIGNFYVEKLRGEVESSMNSYKEWTCNKFLTCLRDEGMYCMNCIRPGLSRSVPRRLKAFNMVFDEIKSLHSSWTVPNLQLRERIRTSMSDKLVPVYQSFLNELSDADIKKKKYSVQDLESLISEEIFAYTEM